MNIRDTEFEPGEGLRTIEHVEPILEQAIEAVEAHFRDGVLDMNKYAEVSARLKQLSDEFYFKFP